MVKQSLIQDLFEEMSALRRLMHGGAEKFFSAYNLTRSQMGMLFLLLHEEGLSVTQIASRTGVTNGAATQTLDVMVRRALVERRADEHDRRVSRLYLSEEGTKLAKHIKQAQTARMTKLLEGLEEPELRSLVTAITKLHQLMEETADGNTNN